MCRITLSLISILKISLLNNGGYIGQKAYNDIANIISICNIAASSDKKVISKD